MGTKLDWGQALRAYRSRTGINQKELARQLGISQPQVSRIEAGTALPRDDVASGIRALLDRPDNRNLFDGLLTSIQFSPHVICLVQPVGDTVRYVALSRGFREHPQLRSIEVGQSVRKDASRNGESMIHDMMRSGIFAGEITAIDAVWEAEIAPHHAYWRGIVTPIRSRDGGWFLHCSMQVLDAARYARLLADRGSPLILHTLA